MEQSTWGWLVAMGVVALFAAAVTAAETQVGPRAYRWCWLLVGGAVILVATSAWLREGEQPHVSVAFSRPVDWLAHLLVASIALILPAAAVLGVSSWQRRAALPPVGRWVVSALAGALAVVPGLMLALLATVVVYQDGP